MSSRGTVEKITERVVPSGSTAYSALINGEWIGLGFDAPSFREGDYISFDVVQKGKYKNLVNPVQETPTGGSAPAATPSAGPSQGFNFRDISIAYQSARRDAIELVSGMLAVEAVKLPAKQADKMDAYVALVNNVTDSLYVSHKSFCDAGGPTEEGAPDTEYDVG